MGNVNQRRKDLGMKRARRYKYSLYWDIIWYLRNKKNMSFLLEKNIKYINFSLKQLFKNIFLLQN